MATAKPAEMALPAAATKTAESNEVKNREGEIIDLLESVYYNPSSSGSYGGINRLMNEANRLLLERNKRPIPRHVVEKYLSSQDAYTLIRPARVRFKRNPYLIRGRGYQFSSDLMDLSQLSDENDGYKWLIIVMDIYSRYVFIRPMKSKSALSVLAALKNIFRESGSYPKKFETDLGKEYWNKLVSKYLKSVGTHHFSKGKTSHVERFIRTFSSRLYRYQAKHNTRRYIDILQQLVQSYNNSVHRSIKTTPYSVFVEGKTPFSTAESEEKKVKEAELLVARKKRRKKDKGELEIGDLVRLSRDPITGNIFEKEAYGRWTEEIFIIHNKVKKDDLITLYTVKDQKGEVIRMNFYKEELQKIETDLTERLFKVEDILGHRTRKGQKQVLVRWQGYPKSFDSWEPEENIVDL